MFLAPMWIARTHGGHAASPRTRTFDPARSATHPVLEGYARAGAYPRRYDARMAAIATDRPVWALIREARRRAGLTQAELAARVRTSQPAIARYERARAMPDLATLHRVVEACGFELRLELAKPGRQGESAARIALERTAEERLVVNTRQVELVHALRHG